MNNDGSYTVTGDTGTITGVKPPSASVQAAASGSRSALVSAPFSFRIGAGDMLRQNGKGRNLYKTAPFKFSVDGSINE
jgi:hypothetical protein